MIANGKPIEPVTFQKTFTSSIASSKINDDTNADNDDTLTVNLKVFVDNKELNIKSTEKTVVLMLKSQNIILSATDKISPSIETELYNGMEVTITRVKTVAIQSTVAIDFKTTIKKDTNTLKSKSKVSQNGVKGQKSVTSNVTYENGKEVSRKIIKEIVTKAPQNKVIVQGTLPTITFSRGGSSSEKIINVKSTAYWAVDGVNNTYTSSGKKAVRNQYGISTIAVDPNVIAMGTKLYVEGYGYAIAADNGSGIKGKVIDVYFNTLNEALDWGVKYIKVQIID